MAEIIVHAGLHKTGSSSIQEALRNSTLTRDRQVFLPAEGGSQSEKEWLRRFRRLASSSQAIWSDENLLGSPFDGYAKASQRMSAFREVMGGMPVNFVVYMRPQLQWLESLYLQGIQEGNSESPTEFLDRILVALNLRWSILGTVIRDELVAGYMDLRAYKSLDVVGDFFSSQDLGSPPRYARNGVRVNQSIAPIQGPILRTLLSDPEMDVANKLRLRQVFQGLLASGAKRGFSSFSKSQQEEIRDLMTQDATQLVTSELMSSEARDAYSREVAILQARPLLPWVEAPESAESLWQESLRCIAMLSQIDVVKKSPWARAIEKLRRNPLDFVSAVKRNVAS